MVQRRLQATQNDRSEIASRCRTKPPEPPKGNSQPQGGANNDGHVNRDHIKPVGE